MNILYYSIFLINFKMIPIYNSKQSLSDYEFDNDRIYFLIVLL